MNGVLALAGYLSLSISFQSKDYAIMRALGAKSRMITKLVLFETIFIIMFACVISFPIGFMVLLHFLIPDAVVTVSTLLAILGIFSILFGTLIFSGLVSARSRSEYF